MTALDVPELRVMPDVTAFAEGITRALEPLVEAFRRMADGAAAASRGFRLLAQPKPRTNAWAATARMTGELAYERAQAGFLGPQVPIVVMPIGFDPTDADRATWMADLVLRTQGPEAAVDVLALYDRLLTR